MAIEYVFKEDGGYPQIKLRQPDSTDKQLQIDNNGCTFTNGTAATKGFLQYFAFDFPGEAGTFNSITCGVAGASTLDDRWNFKSFDDGVGGGIAEAIIMQWCVPEDFAAGKDIVVKFNWVSGVTTGDTRWQCGHRPRSVGDDMTANTNDVWGTPVNVTVPATIWDLAQTSFTLSGTNLAAGDAISIIIFRDADNAADTSSGDSYINLVAIEYERSM